MKKYEITDIKHPENPKLRRIRALNVTSDFCGFKAGDLGGYVESENNLSQEGCCWIYDDAIASEGSWICDNAVMRSKAKAEGSVIICGHGGAFDRARLLGNAFISGNCSIYESAVVKDYTRVTDEACIHGSAVISGKAQISSRARIRGNAVVDGNVRIRFGVLDATPSVVDLLRVSLGTYVVNGKVRLFQYRDPGRVNNMLWFRTFADDYIKPGYKWYAADIPVEDIEKIERDEVKVSRVQGLVECD